MDNQLFANKLKSNTSEEMKYVEANPSIKPSIGTKVAVDYKGLVTKVSNLDEVDIPQLSINKISGLQDLLDSKLDKDNYNPEILHQNVVEQVSVNNRIELTDRDIPVLNIEKIDNLKNLLNNINRDISTLREDIHSITQNNNVVETNLSNQIMSSLNSVITSLEDRVSYLDTEIHKIPKPVDVSDIIFKNKQLEANLKSMSEKISAMETKIGILEEKNNSLESNIIKKANRDDITELNNLVSSLISSGKSNEYHELMAKIETKASHDDYAQVFNRATGLVESMESLVSKLPPDTLMDEITNIKNDLNTLQGDISVIYSKIK